MSSCLKKLLAFGLAGMMLFSVGCSGSKATSSDYEITEALLSHPILPVPMELRQQSAYSVAQVARIAYENGSVDSDITLAPTYLRLSQAERERAERLGLDTGI